MIGGRVLDASAIRDLTIGRTVYGSAFLAAANDVGIELAVPAAALQQAWAGAGPDEHPFLELLLDLPLSVVHDLDADAARESGQLALVAQQSGRWDAGAAHAVLLAELRDWPILTADPEPLQAIDPEVWIERLPS